MPTTRRSQTNVDVLRARTSDAFKILGRADFVITNYSQSPTLNERGRVNTQTSTTVNNVSGNLQFSVKLLKPYIDIGLASQGNGIFYTLATTIINVNDEVVIDSTTWRLTVQVEGETIADGSGTGLTVYQAWIVVRKPEE